MKAVWDYNTEELQKTESGRIFLLERQINFGPDQGTKIELSQVKKYWDKLKFIPKRKKLLEMYL